MKQCLKFLHELAAIGVLGALAAHLILVASAPELSLAEYAALRAGVAAIAKYLLLPSLMAVLVSGLLAMAAHRPFLDMRWVWIKAALGIVMFEGTLGAVQSTAARAAELAARAAAGSGDPSLLAEILRREWIGLWTIVALALANIALAVWRPRFSRRSAA